MVLPPSHKIPRVSWYSGFHLVRLASLRDFHPLWCRLSNRLPFDLSSDYMVHTPGCIAASRFRLFRFRSPLLTESHFVFSSCGYLDVSVPRVSPSYAMYLPMSNTTSARIGFPHSDIRASSDVCSFTRLFAACHVLLRLQVPGHSPCALSSLTCSISDCPMLSHQVLRLFV